METICHFCGNKNFNRRYVQYTYQRHDQFLIVNEVPCEQCEYCGEQYFQAIVLKQIEKEFDCIYQRGKKVEKELRVPVEQFSEIITVD
jgi:YgiT-type zinc finger domain-containing protein